MSRAQQPSRRTVLAVAVAAAVTGTAAPAAAAAPRTAGSDDPGQAQARPIDYHCWTTFRDWRCGTAQGARPVSGSRPGVVIGAPAGRSDYTDPHTGTTASWAYATWTSPVTQVGFDASELVASWNADTPAGTWIQVELQGTYNTGNQTPWYVMGRWASGDQDIRRTTVNRQGDPWSTIWTDTFSIDDVANGVMLRSYQLRLTLYRAPDQWRSPRVTMSPS